jgi:hypothetical protein
MIAELEAGKLAKLIAARDKRTIGDADIDLWMIMAQSAGWNYRQAVRAFIEHSNEHPGEFFEPGHVAKRVAEVRKQISERWYCPDPPRELADDPRGEIVWRRQMAEAFMRHNLDLWAGGYPLAGSSPALVVENEKRGELPAVGSGDSPVKRAAIAEMRKFAQRTRIPKRGEVESERPDVADAS